MPTIEPFSGSESFDAPPAKVYAFLTNPDDMKACIPDLVSAERVGTHGLKGVVKPGFSFLRGKLKFTIDVKPVEPGKKAVMTVMSEGIGTKLGVESTMLVEPAGAGSKVNWDARVTQMGGLISAAPGGLIKAAADKTIRDGWQKIRERLAASA